MKSTATLRRVFLYRSLDLRGFYGGLMAANKDPCARRCVRQLVICTYRLNHLSTQLAIMLRLLVYGRGYDGIAMRNAVY